MAELVDGSTPLAFDESIASGISSPSVNIKGVLGRPLGLVRGNASSMAAIMRLRRASVNC